jgi:Zn-dependent metalloprotease
MKKIIFLLSIWSSSIFSQVSLLKNEKIVHQFSSKIEFEQFDAWINKNYATNYKLEFTTTSEEDDELGFKHIRLQQLINGIPVKNGMIVVHCKANQVISFNGLLYTNATIKSSITTKESEAYLTAIQSIPSSQYAWETSRKSSQKRSPLQINRPKGTLTYIFKNVADKDELELTYSFPIYSLLPLDYKEIYVSCLSGKIVKTEEKIHNFSSIGKGKCKYSDWQNIVTDSTATGFTLKDATRGNGIETYNLRTNKLFENKKNTWDTTTIEQYAIDAHWGAEMTYDYYLKNHNRNSIDNKGFKLINRLRYGTKFINAFWDGSQMNYGDGNDTINPLVSLDIIGHEITHGLTANTAKLTLENESGSLNESFSDIFGATIDWFTRPGKANWHVGEEVSRTYRSLENPEYNKDPKNYKGKNWKPLNGSDLGGIHSNNGVQNHWYYLLAQGGSGTNDFGKSFNVKGIGIEKAAKIAYRNLTIYLTSLSNFEDARFFSIQAAKDLFGPCSPEVESTINAWYAVGVGEPYVAGLKSNFSLSSTNSFDSLFVFFQNKSVNSDSCFWDFGDGTTSRLHQPTHKYTKTGTYTVKLISYGNKNCGEIDSLIFKDTIRISERIIDSVHYSFCDSSNLSLFHSSNQPKVQWYSSLSDSSLITTNPQLDVNVDKDTVYYSKEIPTNFGEKDASTNSANYTFTARHLIFTAHSSFLLKSAIVNSYAKGERTIELRTNKGEVIQQRKILIDTIGIVRIPINFKIDPGVDYQLGVSGSFVNLGRTRNTVNYPYQLDSVVTITRSNAIDMTTNAGTLFYYFFYDWEIIPTEKTQTKAHLIKKIMKPIPSFELTQLANKLIQLESTSKFADSISWKIAKKDSTNDTLWITQSWSSDKKSLLVQTEFNPIRFQLNASNKCYVDSTFKSIQLNTTNIKTYTQNKIHIYPNPANDLVNIESQKEIGDIHIKDITGKIIYQFATNNKNIQINTSQLTEGYYFIEISCPDGVSSEKLIKTQ